MEVTDGWYSLTAQLDRKLCDLVSQGKIKVGDKIVTSGAELVGSQQACSPLEVSTTPADNKWDKSGTFQK